MNLSLIDPFILAQDYPDALTGKIRTIRCSLLIILTLTVSGSGHATCLRFNRRGDLLASGRVCRDIRLGFHYAPYSTDTDC